MLLLGGKHVTVSMLLHDVINFVRNGQSNIVDVDKSGWFLVPLLLFIIKREYQIQLFDFTSLSYANHSDIVPYGCCRILDQFDDIGQRMPTPLE